MQKEYRLLYLLAVPTFVSRSDPGPWLWPHRDGFLYLAEGRHMAWGYMEVSPVRSVFARFTNLFGAGFFRIKCWPSLMAWPPIAGGLLRSSDTVLKAVSSPCAGRS